MIFEKTVQKKKDGKTYKNDIDFKKIYIDDEIHKPYCLLGTTPSGNVLIQQGITICEVPLTEDKKFLLDIFTEKPKPTKKETQKESKKD